MPDTGVADCMEEKGCKSCWPVSTQLRGMAHFQIINHGDTLCKEYVISAPPFHVKSWLFWSAVFNMFGYWLELHTQDSTLMTIMLVIVSLALFVKMNWKIKRESLLVMAGIGVQLTTTFASGRTKQIYYDRRAIMDIVINEAVTMHRVIFYLALMVREERSKEGFRLVPLYLHSIPTLKCLKQIYQGSQAILNLTDS